MGFEPTTRLSSNGVSQNGVWVFVYEISGCGFESCCCHLKKYLRFNIILKLKTTHAVLTTATYLKASTSIRSQRQ